jgi:L-amino acid N-acyltransferase YncA
MGWRVRRAESTDAERIAEIKVLGWQTAYRGIVPQWYLDAMTPEPRVAGWRQVIAAPQPAAIFVAVDAADLPAAYCAVGAVRQGTDRHAELPTGELMAIYADPAQLGRGAGHAAHEAGVAHLLQNGFRYAVLWVFKANASSREFYAAHGWRPDGVLNQDKLGDAEVTEVRYARTLGAQ